MKKKPPGAEKAKRNARLDLEPLYDPALAKDLVQRMLRAQALTRADKAKAERKSHDDAA